MIDQAKASILAREGFDLWQSGRPDEAVVRYQQALEFVDPDHYALADYHLEFAAMLAEIGRDADAAGQYRQAIAVSLRQDQDEGGLGVSIARYFLSELLLKMNKPGEAIETIQPVLQSKMEWLAHVVRADALWKLDRREESKAEASVALSQADSDKKRGNIRERLAHILATED